MSFISCLKNLKELKLTFISLNDFDILQHTYFSQLQVLKLSNPILNLNFIQNFIQVNGKNLRECYLKNFDSNYSCNSLYLAIANFCPNLKKLYCWFKNNEVETLKIVLNSCQYLESIYIRCGGGYLSEKVSLEALAKFSPKNFCYILIMIQ